MWRMLQQPKPSDYVIATGETHSLQEFVEVAFSALNLNWRDHVQSDPALLRPTDLLTSRANPSKAAARLGWNPKYRMSDVAKLIVEAELESIKQKRK
jgi:GDPmannose 4,6-dehydratase